MDIPINWYHFGLYSTKKLFQNYEWLKHNEQSIVATDLVPAPCIILSLYMFICKISNELYS